MELTIQRVFLLHLFTCCVVSSFIFGVKSQIVRSEAEDLELETQLKLINKPAVEILETIDGDTYGCVDFYKQPAFDHPALQNHSFTYQAHQNHSFTYEIKHISYPIPKQNDSNIIDISFGSLWKNGKGCPIGTVPIRRYTKDELVEANLITQAYDDSHETLTNAIQNNHVTHWAMARYLVNKRKIYNGAGMKATIHNPIVQRDEASSTRMVLRQNEDHIHVGWTVNPNLYKDTQTRVYIYTKTAAFKCFNQMCPGFILSNPKIPIGSVFRNVSKIGGPISHSIFFIQKDRNNGNWLLVVGTLTDYTEIGYWPPQIFGSMKGGANYIEWGGMTTSPKGVPSPPMGFGTFPPQHGDFFNGAYCCNLLVVNEADKIVAAAFPHKYTDNAKGYNAVVQSPDLIYGQSVFYGGPGKLT